MTNKPWWKQPKMVVKEERMNQAHQVEEQAKLPKFVLTVIYDEQGVYLSQRINSTKTMYLKYQFPGGKVDPGETGVQAAHKELYEETGLSIPQKRLKKIANDPTFDCDIYTCNLKTEELPQRTEPKEMSEWMYYPWKSFELMIEQERVTPSIVKFNKEIWE